MTTNIQLKNPTCRSYIFKRLLSYVFNQINNSIMVLIETVGQKNKNPRLRDLAAKNSRIRDAKKHKKTRFRDSFKTPQRFRDWNKNFRDPEFSGYHSPPLLLFTKVKVNIHHFYHRGPTQAASLLVCLKYKEMYGRILKSLNIVKLISRNV